MTLQTKIVRGTNRDTEKFETKLNKAISGLNVKNIAYSEYVINMKDMYLGYSALILHEV